MSEKKAIPHIIHYCWFGGNPLPDEAKRCIESWKKYCPDYEIREWNETNYFFDSCDYVREAYEEKKWAFVSDYARFDILYTHGGLYFDTDVELIRPIDDIVQRGPFLGVEQRLESGIFIAPGLGMGVTAGHPIYHEILSAYQDMHFLNADGSHNRTTIVAYTTEIFKKYSLRETTQIQCLEGIWIYPWEYFCPLNPETGVLTISESTRSIHQYSATWLTKEEQSAHQFKIKASKRFGLRIGTILERIYSFPYRVKMKIAQKGLVGTLQFAMEKFFKE